MKSNYNNNEDSEHAKFLMLLAKIAQLAGDKDWRLKNKTEREGIQRNASTVPCRRKLVTQVYGEMGSGYFSHCFEWRSIPSEGCIDCSNLIWKRQGVQIKTARTTWSDHLMGLFHWLSALPARFISLQAARRTPCLSCLASRMCLCLKVFIVWSIQLINMEMEIEFLSSHNKQHNIADWICLKSPIVDTSCSVDTVNGIVIWTHKPAAEDCEGAGVDKSSFLLVQEQV